MLAQTSLSEKRLYEIKHNLLVYRGYQLSYLTLRILPSRDIDLGADNLDDLRSNYRADLAADLATLTDKGIITSPAYWERTAQSVKYLPELIHKMSEAIK